MSIHSVVFGAGRGVRLRPLTDHVAKPALPLLDVPVAAWSLAALATAAPPVVVNASHLAPGLVAALEDLEFPGWNSFVEEPEGYGTAGTLRALRDRVGHRLLTWNGDVLSDLDPLDLLATHEGSGHPATVAVQMVGRSADLEVQNDRVTGFIDRRRQDSVGARFLGIAAFERAALDELPDVRPAGLGETLLRTLADHGELGVHVHPGYWIDVGTPAAYLQASLDALYERAPAPPVSFPGEVVAVPGGRAYVGPGTKADASALGPGAIVLAGATVDAGSSIQDAVVFSGATVPPGAVVTGSIWFDTYEIRTDGRDRS